MRRAEKNITLAHRHTSPAPEVYFWDSLKVILTRKEITLDEF